MLGLTGKCILFFFILFISTSVLYADEIVSLEKLNFVAQELNRSQMSNTQTTLQKSSPVFGIVSKITFINADPNGAAILDDLIKKGILEEVSSNDVRLKQSGGRSIRRPSELLGKNFDRIWIALIKSSPKDQNSSQEIPLIMASTPAVSSSQKSLPVQGLNNFVQQVPQNISGSSSNRPWQLHTQFRSGVAFYNNFFSAPHDPKGEVVFQNGPTFLFSNGNTPFRFNIDYEPTYRTYYRYSNNDSLDHNLKGFYYLPFGKFYDTGDESLAYSSQGVTTEVSAGSRIFREDFLNEFGYNINNAFSAALIYKNDILNYLSSSYSADSYANNTIGPRFYYHVHPQLDVYIQSLYSSYGYNNDADRNSSDETTSVGMRGALGKNTFYQIENGVRTGSSIKGQNGFVTEGVVTQQLTPKTQITFTVKKDTQQSAVVDGVYDLWILSSELTYKYSPKTRISFYSGWQNNSYPYSTTEIDPDTQTDITQKRRDDSYTQRLTLTYNFTHNLTLQGIISSTEHVSNFKINNYDDYFFESSLIYAF